MPSTRATCRSTTLVIPATCRSSTLVFARSQGSLLLSSHIQINLSLVMQQLDVTQTLEFPFLCTSSLQSV